MARSSAAVAHPAPAKRRKPSTAGGRHASTQTRRPARRVSGHARTRPKAAPKRQPARAGTPRVRTAAPRTTAPRTRTAPLVQRLAKGRAGAVADQLLRGRACVAIVFALLVGIVFLNVSLLEMNEGIARTNAQATALEHENAKLRTQLAPLGSSERIQREAVKRGYSLPAAGDVGYVTGTAGQNAKKAVERMTAPGMGEGTASRPAAMVQEQRVGAQPAATAQPAAPPPAPPAQTAPAATTAPVQPTTPAASTAPAQPATPTANSAPASPTTTGP